MSLLVVGSVGYDTVWTPLGSGTDLLGGSATFFSIAASYFGDVSLVAVVGSDFRDEDVNLLTSHGVGLDGLETAPGETFRWVGRYNVKDPNSRDTLETHLNVLAGFQPNLNPDNRKKDFLFLGNIDPELQLQVLQQMDKRPKLVASDTMDFWIESKFQALCKVVREVDVVFMDEGEIRSFSQESDLIKAARSIIDMGPQTVVAKRGANGVFLVTAASVFSLPAYPVKAAVDPTGAGDSFAGGFLGYISRTEKVTFSELKRATVLGSIMGSFAVENLSVGRLKSVTRNEVTDRFSAFFNLTNFDGLGDDEALHWRTS